MAIYHCSASTIGRGGGRSIVAASAYRSGERLDDERTGLTHDFTRKRGVIHSEIMTSAGSPAWAQERAELWNAAERAEDKSTRRATATTAREFRLALPHELDGDGQIAAVRDFGRHMVETYGVAVDFSIHEPDRHGDERNYHAHILTSDRRLTDAGFAGKVRELNTANGGKENVAAIRAKWAEIANRHLEAAGIDSRIDHRRLADQGSDQTASVHLGPKASGIERRGEASDIGDLNRAAAADNEQRAALKAELAETGAAMKAEEVARQQRADERDERAAVRTHDPAAILAAMTEKRSTFTEAELVGTIRKTVADQAERERLAEAILSRSEIVGLAEQQGGKATRYTTKAVLEHEQEGLAVAGKLAADRSHAVSRATLHGIAERGQFGSMSEEQYAAFIRSTGPEGLAIIAGEAGTGKSYAANAIRTAYEAEGGRVIGLAVTNKVIQDLQDSGFGEVRTVDGALHDLAKGRANWNERTVLIVDEAAMLSTRQTVELLTAAQQAGAKVIAIQDEAQLGSAFARGGLAGAIREQHPAVVSELSEIRRIKDGAEDATGQRRAFNLMHAGNFREALAIFDKQGAISWNQTQDEARAALAAQYAEDLGTRPDKRRFAFVHTNAEALTINADLRAVHRERGELGDDHIMRTKDGPTAFAAGDRIQFTGSAYSRADKQRGLVNGMVGSVVEIEGERMTVQLDTKGDDMRLVSFTVGENGRAGEFNAFRHGYAGTVYRGQGSTVDDAYRLHSGQERAATSYVGNTRHAEALHIFTSREAVRGADPWMREQGGLDGLSEGKRESAERSYAAWTAANPELGRRHDLADYVAYVQDRWTEDKSRAVDLEHLARQMSRTEEGRAASQFHRAEIDPARTFENAAAEALQRRKDAAGMSERPSASSAPEAAGTPAAATPDDQAPAVGRRYAELGKAAKAQRTAARVGKIADPARQAAALQKAHERDAGKSPPAAPDIAAAGKAVTGLEAFEADMKAAEAAAKKADDAPERGRQRQRDYRTR